MGSICAMNRSHLLPATLLVLAAVAIAQSTQNQSNIARLVNVINQVTAKVDGVIPLREHVSVVLTDVDAGGIDWTVPDGIRAQLVGSSGLSDAYLASLYADLPSGDTHFLQRLFSENVGINAGGAGGVLANGLVLEPGSRVWIDDGTSEAARVLLTFALEEI